MLQLNSRRSWTTVATASCSQLAFPTMYNFHMLLARHLHTDAWPCLQHVDCTIAFTTTQSALRHSHRASVLLSISTENELAWLCHNCVIIAQPHHWLTSQSLNLVM